MNRYFTLLLCVALATHRPAMRGSGARQRRSTEWPQVDVRPEPVSDVAWGKREKGRRREGVTWA